MIKYQRQVKVGNTEAYKFNVSSWSSTEDISTFTATHDGGLLSVISSSFEGAQLSFLVTGIAIGTAEVHLSFTTATRSNCVSVEIDVIEEC